MESHLFAYLYRLRYIERWSLMRNVHKENVAEHSYHVALLTHALCSIANEIFNRDIPTGEAVAKALFHDVSEVFTGDIPTPVKHHSPESLQNFREIERIAAERLVGMVPEPLLSVYRPLIGGKQDNHPLYRYIKAADLLDAYLKCSSELSAGNREFAVAQKQIEAAMQRMDMPEIGYFLEHWAPSFEKTLDELSGT